MPKTEDTVVVFTARSPDRLLKEGGSQAWVLNPARAKRCKWLVCTQNQFNPDHEFSDATEPHGTGFLLAKIAGVVRSRERPSEKRWLIEIGEYARINVPNLWDHGRNPVRYTSLADLGVDVDDLKFQALLTERGAQRATDRPNGASDAFSEKSCGDAALTIAAAKRGLALTYGVPPDCIEITIRG
jgi:hypothetical protein